MKKIPTLFERQFENHKIVGITDKITPGCEDALEYGVATIKYDGSCCAIINGKYYKRYDAKKGKQPPEGAIPCCDPDPITGHWPHWVMVDPDDPADKWFVKAMGYAFVPEMSDISYKTYEAVGPHFNGNPHNMTIDTLTPHGLVDVVVDRTFTGIKTWLEDHEQEGLVFWLEGEPVCKIKRTDFGLPWPIKN